MEAENGCQLLSWQGQYDLTPYFINSGSQEESAWKAPCVDRLCTLDTYCLPLTHWVFYQAHLCLPGLGPATLHIAVGHSGIYTVQAKHTVVERDGQEKEMKSELL